LREGDRGRGTGGGGRVSLHKLETLKPPMIATRDKSKNLYEDIIIPLLCPAPNRPGH